jgi:hypothetical protein
MMELSGLTGSRGVLTYKGMKIAVNILLRFALLVVALSLILVYANIHPPRYPLHIPPSTYHAAYEDATFETSDGVTLKGWLMKPPEEKSGMPAIIICHGLVANRSDFTNLAVYLARRGYFVLPSISALMERAKEAARRWGTLNRKTSRLLSHFLLRIPGSTGTASASSDSH